MIAINEFIVRPKYIRNQIKSNELRPQLAYVPQTTISCKTIPT